MLKHSACTYQYPRSKGSNLVTAMISHNIKNSRHPQQVYKRLREFILVRETYPHRNFLFFMHSQHPKLYISSWLKWLGRLCRQKNYFFSFFFKVNHKEKSSTNYYISCLISSCRYKSHHYCDADKLHFLAQKVLPFMKEHLAKEAESS